MKIFGTTKEGKRNRLHAGAIDSLTRRSPEPTERNGRHPARLRAMPDAGDAQAFHANRPAAQQSP